MMSSDRVAAPLISDEIMRGERGERGEPLIRLMRVARARAARAASESHQETRGEPTVGLLIGLVAHLPCLRRARSHGVRGS